MAKKEIATSHDEKEPRIYEAGYLMLPSFSPEEASLVETQIKSTLEKMGAEIISSEPPVLRELSYQMVKEVKHKKERFNQGYFGWIKFSLSQTEMEGLKKFMDDSEDFIRYILIETVAENTLISKRPPRVFEKKTAPVAGEKDVRTATDEEINKTIAELVA